MQDLTDLTRKLNEKSDNLNALISSMNEKLARMNIGVEVWIQSNPRIGYLELEGQWQIVVNPGSRTQPLLKAPREVRIAAMACIPSLLSQLKQKVASMLASIEAAERAAQSL